VLDNHNAAASAASLALAYAMQNAGSTDPTAVRNALAQLNVTTFFGEIRFDALGVNVYKPIVVSQVQYGKLVPIYPAKNAQRSKTVKVLSSNLSKRGLNF
jgi:branched-chain amino acid transport system substrate-binding protein